MIMPDDVIAFFFISIIAHPPFRMLSSYHSVLYTIKLMILRDSDEHAVHSWVLSILKVDILVLMI